MSRLYIPWLPQPQATTQDAGISALIQQAGLLQRGGTATEKISAENIDLVLNGQWRFGATFSTKQKKELQSLAESDYDGVPYYDPNKTIDNQGYYEVERVAVNPAYSNTEDAFEWTAALTFTGTRQTHWRAVKTNVETIETGLATGSGGLIGIPGSATKVRWFDIGQGTESATADSTVAAEFGDIELYDPTQPSFDDPTLIYEVPYADERGADVRVFDDLNKDKYVSINGTDFNQWVHAFHTSFEFDGNPIVDNGLVRTIFDESAGVVEVFEWDDANTTWSQLTIDHSNFSLVDADLIEFGPADQRTFAEFVDDGSGELYNAILSVQRGNDEIVARAPDGATWTTAFETYLDQFVSNQTTDPKPNQTLTSRNEVQ